MVHVKPNREKNLDPIRGTDLRYEQLLQTLVDDGFTVLRALNIGETRNRC